MTAPHPWGWLALLVAAAGTGWVQALHGLPLVEQALLLVAYLALILLPGVTLTTWVRRAPLFVRLSAAFVCGLPVQLLGWLAGVVTGMTFLMWFVPMAFGVAVGWLRWRVILAGLRSWPVSGPLTSVVLLIAWFVLLARYARFWAENPVARAAGWYADLYWHLAINASAAERVPLADPQAIGEFLSYHWLTNAHIGGLAKATGVDVLNVTAIGWHLPVVAALLGVTYGFALYVARSGRTALLATVLVVVPPVFLLNCSLDAGGHANFAPLSPSHMLTMPVTVTTVWLVAVLLKAGAGRRREVLPALLAVLLLMPGVKVSSLPVLLCGVLAAFLPALVARSRRRLTAVVAAAVVAVLVATLPLFGGGGGGSSFAWLGSQQTRPLWEASIPHLTHLGPRGDAFMLYGFVVVLLTNLAWVLPGIAAMRWRDPVGWLLLGVISSAVGVTWVLVHPGQSQLYFPMGVQPLMAIAAAVGVGHLVRRFAPPVIGVGATAVPALLVGMWVTSLDRLNRLDVPALAGALAIVLAVLLTATVLWLWWPRGGAVAAVALLAFSMGGQLPASLDLDDVRALVPSRAGERATEPEAHELLPGEWEASRQAASILPEDAVLATNLHCRNVETTEHCEARGFWVAALTGRPVLLGGWAYTTLGRSTQGDGGRYHVFNPYPDQELFQLNEAAFRDPSEETLAGLRDRGVTHLFGVHRAGEVSPALAQWCTTEFENDDVILCALDEG